MTPRQLRDKWNLTNYQLACSLGKTEQTVKSYMFDPKAKGFRNTPLSTRILCAKLDKEWQHEGTPNIIFLTA
ncbi:MAG: hypothetical protein AB1589_30915 [Cyanobacteriota bacterium]